MCDVALMEGVQRRVRRGEDVVNDDDGSNEVESGAEEIRSLFGRLRRSDPPPVGVGLLVAKEGFSRPYALWQCGACAGFFAGADPWSWSLRRLGMVVAGRPGERVDPRRFAENRRVNEVRRHWAAIRVSGPLCRCGGHDDWPTRDDLHELLPETQQEQDELDRQWREGTGR